MATEPTTSTVPHDGGRGPVLPTAGARAALHPAAISSITGGFWHARQLANRDAGLPDGFRQLQVAGNRENLERAAEGAPPLRAGSRIDPSASGLDADSGGYRGPLFMDSDVYKWLEAAAWERQREASELLAGQQAALTAEVAAAQRADGYLNSFVQIVTGAPWADLAWSHELYCAGHLMQASVAAHRAAPDDDALVEVSRRFADLLDETFGPGPDRSSRVDGHPIVEMALVELYRETGEQRYLELAQFAVEARGRSDQKGRPFDFVYYSDRVPVREATTLEGHAVRALYLASGATDVAVELDDTDLLDALEHQWEAMVESKMYVTGGLGARWEGESFGAPYELPNDRAYAETCAAIASVQWSWRLLLATGRARYADLIERTLFNGMLAGVSLDGQHFFYANVLQLREGAVPTSSIDPSFGRQRWFSTACCPPNVMRTLAQLQHYLATSTADGLQLHQFATGTVRADVAGGALAVAVTTGYPNEGAVTLRVTSAPGDEASISVRVPAWAADATLTVNGEAQVAEAGAYATVRRTWSVGDVVELTLPMAVRLTRADPRVDAARGSVAVERGPVVYCVESIDNPSIDLDRVQLDVARFEAEGARESFEPELLGGVTVLTLPAQLDGAAVKLTAIPYAVWANRTVGPMRVWLPTP